MDAPRLFTVAGGLGLAGSALALVGGGLGVLLGHHTGSFAAAGLGGFVFSIPLLLIGLDLWSEADKLKEAEL